MSRAAVVTGGTKGIGLAVARALQKNGDRVAVTSRSETEAPEGLLAVPCDVRDRASVDSAFDAAEAEHGPTAVLVANAGIAVDGLLIGTSDDVLEDLLAVDLAGTFRTVRRAATAMLRAKQGGRIVLVSSVVGFTGSRGQSAYAAAKSGLLGLARSSARELAPRGITVNVVAPGYVETGMTEGLSERRRAEVVAGTPAGRLAEPAEIAAAVAYLASPEAAFVTGAVLPVDGGLGMGL